MRTDSLQRARARTGAFCIREESYREYVPGCTCYRRRHRPVESLTASRRDTDHGTPRHATQIFTKTRVSESSAPPRDAGLERPSDSLLGRSTGGPSARRVARARTRPGPRASPGVWPLRPHSSSVGCVENQVSDRPRLCTLWDGCFRPSSAHGRRAAPAEARTMGETGAVVDGVDSHACSSSAAAASSGSGGGGGEGETVSMTLLARQ